MILGKNLIVSIDGTPIAAAKSCRIPMLQDFIKACSPTEGRVMDKIPTTYDWGASVDGLFGAESAPEDLTSLLVAGTRVLLHFTDGSSQRRAGFAYVKKCEQSGKVGSLAAFTAAFESTGAIYKYLAYEANEFTEGQNLQLGIENNTVTYNFASSGSKTLGVQVTLSGPAKLYLGFDETWAVYSTGFTAVKSALQQHYTELLNLSLVKCGDTFGQVLTLTAGTYTILVDDATGPNFALQLY